MHVVASALAALLYTAASVGYALWFARARPGAATLTAALMSAGVLVQSAAVALYWTRFHEPPLVGFGPSLATLALLIALAVTGLGFFSTARAVGLILAPVAVVLLLSAMVIRIEPAGSEPLFRGPWLAFHVSLSFIGYTGWVVAAAAASMYLLQFRELKYKRLGAVFQFFPALETLDKLSEWSLVTGFAALTLGILVGAAWAVRFEPSLSWADPKIAWGTLAWVVLLLALWLRLSGRRTSREAALWNVAGFGLVLVAYFVAKLMAPETRFFL